MQFEEYSSFEEYTTCTAHNLINNLRLLPSLGNVHLIFQLCITIPERHRKRMDLIEGKNRISNEKDRIDRIFIDNKEAVCRVLTKDRACADSEKTVVKQCTPSASCLSSRMILQRKP